MTKLERNSRVINTLNILRDAYRTGNFTQFVRLLSDDCIYKSMWVSDPLRGKVDISNHLLGKGKSLQTSNAFPRCWIVEVIGKADPLPETDTPSDEQQALHFPAPSLEPGTYCLEMEQKLNGSTNRILLALRLTDSDTVSRIDLCPSSLFRTRVLFPFITIAPTNGTSTNYDAEIYIGEAYFNELYAFFHMVGEEFDEYDDLTIPMERWQDVLACWNEFSNAEDYDTIAEKMVGINYDTWTVTHPHAHDLLGQNGAILWNKRNLHATMLHDLLEWTQKYSNMFQFIRTFGY